MDPAVLAQRWREAREAKGLSMNALDKALGQSSGFTTLVERARKPGITLDLVCRAARELDVSVDWLAGLSTDRTTWRAALGRDPAIDAVGAAMEADPRDVEAVQRTRDLRPLVPTADAVRRQIEDQRRARENAERDATLAEAMRRALEAHDVTAMSEPPPAGSLRPLPQSPHLLPPAPRRRKRA